MQRGSASWELIKGNILFCILQTRDAQIVSQNRLQDRHKAHLSVENFKIPHFLMVWY